MKLKVTGMTCAHCVRAVDGALRAVPGVTDVAVNLERGEVDLGGTPDPEAVRAAVAGEGYDVVALEA